MTTQKNFELDDGPDTASAVAEYLRKHPGFFIEQPGLLADLKIPHASGDAVSLVERQVTLLREKNKTLSARLHNLVAVAEENETLSRKIHQLILRLIEADGYKDVFSLLHENLLTEFGADRTALLIFAEPVSKDGEDYVGFLGRGSAVRREFEGVLKKQKPVCGRLTEAQTEVLFSDDETRMESAVVIPLVGGQWDGILAAGSREPAKYHANMGIDLLVRLAEITGAIIDRWIKQ